MLIRKRLLAFTLAPCLIGCAMSDPAPHTKSALEQWAAEVEATQGERPTFETVSFSSDAAHTRQWFEAQGFSARYSQALTAWQKDDTATCRQLLTGILEDKPDHRDSLLLMAQVEMLERTPGAVYPSLNDYCAANPSDAAAVHMFGLVCESLGQKKNALACYRRAATIEPDNIAFQSSVDGLTNPERSLLTPEKDESQSPSATDRWASTTANSNSLVTTTPRSRIVDDYSSTSTETHDLLAASQEALGVTPAKAISSLSSEPYRNAEKYTELYAASQLKRNKPHMSDEEHDRVKQASATIEPSPSVRQASLTEPFNPGIKEHVVSNAERDTAVLTQAIELVSSGTPADAIKLLDAHPELERSARYFRIYGMSQYESGDAEGAAASLSRSLSLDDTSALSYFLMGASLSQIGRATDAESHFQQAARLDPRFSRAKNDEESL